MPNHTGQEVLGQQGCLEMSQNGELHLGAAGGAAAEQEADELVGAAGCCLLHQAAESRVRNGRGSGNGCPRTHCPRA